MEPLLVSPMPLQMGCSEELFGGIHKSVGINIVTTHAPDVILDTGTLQGWRPDCVIIDFATIIHQASPKAGMHNHATKVLHTWEAHSLHLLGSFLCETCTHGKFVGQIIL